MRFRTLAGVGTFLYDTNKSTSHFHPLDCEAFFNLVASGNSDRSELEQILLDEYGLKPHECTKFVQDTLQSLKDSGLV